MVEGARRPLHRYPLLVFPPVGGGALSWGWRFLGPTRRRREDGSWTLRSRPRRPSVKPLSPLPCLRSASMNRAATTADLRSISTSPRWAWTPAIRGAPPLSIWCFRQGDVGAYDHRRVRAREPLPAHGRRPEAVDAHRADLPGHRRDMGTVYILDHGGEGPRRDHRDGQRRGDRRDQWEHQRGRLQEENAVARHAGASPDIHGGKLVGLLMLNLAAQAPSALA